MGCEYEKPEENIEELRAEEGQVKDFRSRKSK